MSEVIKIEEYSAVVKAKRLDNNLDQCFSDVANTYVQIGGYLNEMNEAKHYEVLDYKSIYEYAADRFNLSKTTCSNFINLYKRFGEETGYSDDYALKEEYEDYSYSQLVELVSIDEGKILDYSPNLTVKEIRAVKKLEKYNNLLVQEVKKLLIDFVENKELLNRFLTPNNNTIMDLEKNIDIYSSYVKLYIPCEIELEEIKEEASFYLRVDLTDSGLIEKKFNCNYYKYYSFSDVPNFSFSTVDLNKNTMIEAMNKFNEYYDDFIDKVANSEDRIKTNLFKEKSEQINEKLKTFKAYSIQDLIDNEFENCVSKITQLLFQMIKNLDKNNKALKKPFEVLYKPYIYKSGYRWFIHYRGLDIEAESYSIILIRDTEKKILRLSDFLEMLNNSNGTFYPIDLLSFFGPEEEIPTSEYDFDNLEEIY